MSLGVRRDSLYHRVGGINRVIFMWAHILNEHPVVYMNPRPLGISRSGGYRMSVLLVGVCVFVVLWFSLGVTLREAFEFLWFLGLSRVVFVLVRAHIGRQVGHVSPYSDARVPQNRDER